MNIYYKSISEVLIESQSTLEHFLTEIWMFVRRKNFQILMTKISYKLAYGGAGYDDG